MPVIGRLDEQVDDLLIKPLSKKGALEDAPARVRERPAAAPPAPTGEHPEATGDNSARQELPVWLL